MGDQRQLFRFRLPWLSAPRPTAEPQPSRPTAQTRAPAQSTTTIPIQRQPFRPPGIAPARPPPSTQTKPPQTELPTTKAANTVSEPRSASQPTSPTLSTAQSRSASVPPSPSRQTDASRVPSQTASPAHGAIQTQAASQTQSTSRAATESTAASLPPSPSRTASQPQPTLQTVPKLQSPSRLASQPAGETSLQTSSPSRRSTQMQPIARGVSQPPSPPKSLLTQESSRPPISTQPASSTSEQEKKLAPSLQPSIEAQPKTESTAGSPKKPPVETTIKPSDAAVQPAQTSAPVAAAAPIFSESTETAVAPLRPKENEQAKKGGDELMKEDKKKEPSHEESVQKNIAKLLAAASEAGKQTKEMLSTAMEGRKQKEKLEVERKKTLTTTNTDEKQIKTVSSTHPKDRSIQNNSHQKHINANGEQTSLHKEIREDISKFIHKLSTEIPKLPTDEKPIRVITLAGENKGASMNLSSESAKKEGSVHIYRGYKSNPDESPEATTDGDVSSKGRRSKDSVTKEDSSRAYVNSNTQSINNTLMFDSSVNERNPGVQLVFSHSLPEPTKPSTKTEPLETRKAEFNITPAEKLTYEPRVRRRCLRGLFLESSDSEPDNPEKPRRHGCRYNCVEKGKEKERDSLTM